MSAAAPSDEQFAFLTGANLESLPERAVAQLLKAQTTGFAISAPVARLLKTVDGRLPLWAVAVITPAYQQLSILQPFEGVRLQAAPTSKGLEFQLRARQREGADMHDGIAGFMAEVNHLQANVTMSIRQAAYLEPVKQLLASVDVREEGAVATAHATLRATPEEIFKMAVMLDPRVSEAVSSATAPALPRPSP